MDAVSYALAKSKMPIKSSGFPWPSDLIAFWDFSEASAPYYAKAGVDKFPLVVGGTAPIGVTGGPFGNGLQFNGSSDYLKITNANMKALDVAKFGDKVTVVAWVNCQSSPAGFVAGIWQEDDGDPHREYGLFVNLPVYGGRQRVCGHVSKTGGASPSLPYSRDYSSSGRMISTGQDKCIGFTYDGSIVKSYLDGVADERPVYTEPVAPNGEGLTYAKNPYSFDLGLNRSSSADFTVGACKLTAGMDNFFNSTLYGLAIFGKALTAAEMMQLHLYSTSTTTLKQIYDCNIEGTTNSYPGSYGWVVASTATATNKSMSYDDFQLTRIISMSNKAFIFRQGEKAFPGLITITGFNTIKLGQISAITFLLNNKMANDNIKLCLKVGDNWYATATDYDSGAVGASGADWSTAVLQTVNPTVDKTEWLEMTYTLDTALSLGAAPSNNLANDAINGIGFYSPSVQSGGIVRITDLKIYA